MKSACLLLAMLVALLVPAIAGLPASAGERGSVYLLRGAFDVYSLGLDDIAERLRDAGLPAIVGNHTKWKSYAADIEKRRKAGEKVTPVIIIGHSWGSDAAMLMATELKSYGIPVELVVTFDLMADYKAPANVHRALNLHVARGAFPIEPGPGFHGEIDNIDVDDPNLTHASMDEDPGLQERAFKAAVSAFRGR